MATEFVPCGERSSTRSCSSFCCTKQDELLAKECDVNRSLDVRSTFRRARLNQGTGKLSMVVWERFLLHLKPRTTQQERALYFEIASSFADTLDVLGFMDLRQASPQRVLLSALFFLCCRRSILHLYHVPIF